jgi:hypothetical protein
MGEVRVRHHQRRWLVESPEVSRGIDGPHTRSSMGMRNVDRAKPSVAIRTAQNRRMEHPWRIDIVDERAHPAQQPRVLDSPN